MPAHLIADHGVASPSIAAVEKSGLMFRKEDHSCPPYVVLRRLLAEIPADVAPFSGAFKKLSDLTRWHSFERLGSFILALLVLAYRSQGITRIKIRDLFRGCEGSEATLALEFALPERLVVCDEIKQWVKMGASLCDHSISNAFSAAEKKPAEKDSTSPAPAAAAAPPAAAASPTAAGPGDDADGGATGALGLSFCLC